MSSQVNGNNNRRTSRVSPPEKPSYAQHDDLIKYIFDSWNRISQEVERSTNNTAVYYQEQENQNLKDFEPFDLEAYCNRHDPHKAQHANQS